MKIIYRIFLFTGTLAAGLLAGCGTTQNASLERAKTQYQSAQADPQVIQYAAVELRQAESALQNAEAAARRDESAEKVTHLAYLAEQESVLAQESAKLRAAEAYVSRAGGEQSKVQLEARTREAATAKQQAELAQLEARTAQQSEASAKQQAELAQLEIRNAQEREASAKQQAQQSQQEVTQAAERERALQLQLGAKETERGLVLTLNDLLFENNKAQLQPGGNRSIDRVANALRQYPERRIRIEGFTDSVGDDAYNKQLSEQRAQAVRQALIDKGIAGNRIDVQGHGEEFPVTTNATAAGRQLNRRVEIIISDQHGGVGP